LGWRFGIPLITVHLVIAQIADHKRIIISPINEMRVGRRLTLRMSPWLVPSSGKIRSMVK
jgi:hypothetical protein